MTIDLRKITKHLLHHNPFTHLVTEQIQHTLQTFVDIHSLKIRLIQPDEIPETPDQSSDSLSGFKDHPVVVFQDLQFLLIDPALLQSLDRGRFFQRAL